MILQRDGVWLFLWKTPIRALADRPTLVSRVTPSSPLTVWFLITLYNHLLRLHAQATSSITVLFSYSSVISRLHLAVLFDCPFGAL